MDYLAQINNLSEHFGHVDINKEPSIILNGLTRELTCAPGYNKTVAIAGDVSSNVILFKCDRIIEGHDISKCNKQSVWYKKGEEDSVEEELTIVSVENDLVYFSWHLPIEITRKACEFAILLKFSDFEGQAVIWSWKSFACDGLEVVEGSFGIGVDILSDMLKYRNVQYDVFYPTTTGNYVDFEEGYIYYALNCSLSAIGYVAGANQSNEVNNATYIRGIGDIYNNMCTDQDIYIEQSIGDNQSSALSTFYLKDGCVLMLGTSKKDDDGYGYANMFVSTLPNNSEKQALVSSPVLTVNGQASAWGQLLQFVPYNTSNTIVVRIKLKK